MSDAANWRKGRTPARDADFANRLAAKLRAQPNMGVFVVTIPGDPRMPASVAIYGADGADVEAAKEVLSAFAPTAEPPIAAGNATRKDFLPVPDLLAALQQCADQFAFYADEHTKAGKTEKAATNQRFADLARAAIARATGGE